MWLSRPAVLAIVAFLLAGCALTPPPPVPVDFEAPYTLDSGDKLRVVVFGRAD